MKNKYTNFLKTTAFLFTILMTQSLYASEFPAKGDFSEGSKAWSENCARCHNMRSPADLRDDQWVTSVFHMRVRAGLTGQEARDILTFLQASNAPVKANNTPVSALNISAPATTSGKQVYENNCVACHGENGKGSLPGMPDFTSENGPLSKGDNELLDHIISGFQSPGSPMPMPPRGGNSQISDSDLNTVLSYIRATFSK